MGDSIPKSIDKATSRRRSHIEHDDDYDNDDDEYNKTTMINDWDDEDVGNSSDNALMEILGLTSLNSYSLYLD